jgi:uncharacterized protein (DUF885 family)
MSLASIRTNARSLVMPFVPSLEHNLTAKVLGVACCVMVLASCAGTLTPTASAPPPNPPSTGTGTGAQASSSPPSTSPGRETTTPSTNKAQVLSRLYADYWEAALELNPLRATFVGDARYNDRLPDVFAASYRARVEAFNREWLAKLEGVGSDGLQAQDLLSWQLLARNLRQEIESQRFPQWKVPLNQFNNIAATFAQLGAGGNAQPFRTAKDHDDWLARAAQIPTLLRTIQDNMRIGMREGIVQPKALMVKVLPQLDGLIKAQAEDTVFWQPVAKRSDGRSEADHDKLTQRYRKLIADELMPAYRELRRFVADEYLPACRDSVALSALPDGAAWYAYLVRRQTTTDMTPARIHAVGLREVARIQRELDTVRRQLRFAGTRSDFNDHLNASKRFEFATEASMLEAYRALEPRVNQRVGELFTLVPKAAFEIRPVEAYRAASAAGGSYQRPSADGKRPGVFYLNTYDLPSRRTWEAESLYLHEAIPGHHFQLALQQELGDVPTFRRFLGETAFIEGWGLYAESLGKALGLYSDPYQQVGRLQGELWRAIRLVVDTGLHSKGWTREQVIRYMKRNSATSDTEAVAEAERYIAIPGQALAYKIGELKILELRERARRALGKRFDIREFHAEVLKDGSVPLQVLEEKIERFVAARR